MRVLMARFFNHMVSENVQVFWGALRRGEFITDAAEAAGTYRKQGTRWVIANGGVRPRRGRNPQGRYLSFAEREETALGRAAGESMRSIAGRLGRSPSTISRELGPNAELPGRYRATSAHAQAWGRAARPKPAKLARRPARPLDVTEAPKGTDLSVHSAEHVDAVTRELNTRPRKTLGYLTPAVKFRTEYAARRSA